MDKVKIKEIIESSLEGSTASVEGGEGKFTAKIIFDGEYLDDQVSSDYLKNLEVLRSDSNKI